MERGKACVRTGSLERPEALSLAERSSPAVALQAVWREVAVMEAAKLDARMLSVLAQLEMEAVRGSGGG